MPDPTYRLRLESEHRETCVSKEQGGSMRFARSLAQFQNFSFIFLQTIFYWLAIGGQTRGPMSNSRVGIMLRTMAGVA